jgi:hypothetical protein
LEKVLQEEQSKHEAEAKNGDEVSEEELAQQEE